MTRPAEQETPAPKTPELPPEMELEIREALTAGSGLAPRDLSRFVADRLAPLLAELEERRRRQFFDLQRKAIDVGNEARVLREALEWYADGANYDDDLAPGEWLTIPSNPSNGGEEYDFEPDHGSRARAALAASPATEPRCETCGDTGWYEVMRTWIDGSRVVRKACACGAPATEPEQEEAPILLCPEGHTVKPARLSVAEGLYYCDGCREGPKAYYSRGDLREDPRVDCVDCGFPMTEFLACKGSDGRWLCDQCVMGELGVASSTEPEQEDAKYNGDFITPRPGGEGADTTEARGYWYRPAWGYRNDDGSMGVVRDGGESAVFEYALEDAGARFLDADDRWVERLPMDAWQRVDGEPDASSSSSGQGERWTLRRGEVGGEPYAIATAGRVPEPGEAVEVAAPPSGVRDLREKIAEMRERPTLLMGEFTQQGYDHVLGELEVWAADHLEQREETP